MKRKAISRPKVVDFDFPSFETYLGSTLEPVQPRAIFISGLKSRLETEAHARHVGLSPLQYLALAIIAVASTALLVLTGVRAVAALIASLSLLRLSRGRAGKETPSTIAPAP